MSAITVSRRGDVGITTKNNQFTVLIKPPKGATLNLTRTLPSSLNTVMNLN